MHLLTKMYFYRYKICDSLINAPPIGVFIWGMGSRNTNVDDSDRAHVSCESRANRDLKKRPTEKTHSRVMNSKEPEKDANPRASSYWDWILYAYILSAIRLFYRLPAGFIMYLYGYIAHGEKNDLLLLYICHTEA